MPIKSLLYRFQPAQLHIVLFLSICYFAIQLVFSYMTHSLTLLMSAYHSLCNIFALTGCIITIKHSETRGDSGSDNRSHSVADSTANANYEGGQGTLAPAAGSTADSSCNGDDTISVEPHKQEEMPVNRASTTVKRREMKLRNTFGWTRIDILTMLIVCIILCSLSFSMLVESLQILVHMEHLDTMHLPIPVMIVGFVGIVLNGLTYLLIGGYTMHQGSFLHVTPSGDVVLDSTLANNGETTLKPNDRQLSKTKNDQIQQAQKPGTPRQGAFEMLRDLSSVIFVIVCAIIVCMAEDEKHTAKFIDPIIAILSCILLVSLSYPYMKESCCILLQTIPDSINMEVFERTLITKFPEIVSCHDFHIWQLTAQKSVATVHITFQNPKMYVKLIDDIRGYFHDQGINQVTIQPEFHRDKGVPSLECLVQCNTIDCIEKVCCRGSRGDLSEVLTSGTKAHSVGSHLSAIGRSVSGEPAPSEKKKARSLSSIVEVSSSKA